VVVLCNGCASSGVIRGTLSTRTPAELATPPEPNGERASVHSSLADAVVYLEEAPPRGELRIPAEHGSPRVDLRGENFRPRILVIPVGTSVEFANHDTLFHDIFSVSPAKPFDLGRYGRGGSRRVTFDKPGPVNVYCKLHPNMAAYILVVPNRAFARPDSSGRFVLRGLPGGRYVVNAWHPDFPAIRREVTVKDGETLKLAIPFGS